MEHDAGLMIAAAGLAIVVLSSVGGLVWKLARQEAILRADFELKINEQKEKLYKVEIWARDEFVRRGSFDLVVGRLEKGFSELRGEIANRLDRMGEKIDHMGDHRG